MHETHPPPTGFIKPVWLWILFLSAHASIAYTSWPIWVKIPAGLFGLLLPLLAEGVSQWRRPSPDPSAPPVLSDPPWFVPALLIAFLLFTQFYRLAQNPFWITMDDSRYDYFGMQVFRQWDGRLQYGESQILCLYPWTLGLLSHWIAPTQVLYRAVPAVLSTLTAGMSYWAARQFFDKGRSLMTAAFLAFGFGPYTISRMHQGISLSLFLECAILGLLGRFFSGRRDSWILPAALGLALGAGLYTYHAWGVVAFWTLGLLAWDAVRTRRFRGAAVAGTVFLATASPILAAFLSAHGLDHFQNQFGPRLAGLPYLVGLFWNGSGSAPYGPAWGGWFNASAGSLVFLGILRMIRERSRTYVVIAASAAVLFILPGALTSSVQMLRVLPILPVAALCMAAGTEFLVTVFRPNRRWILALSILALSAGWDAFHYLGPYLDPGSLAPGARGWRSVEMSRAYKLLEEKSRNEGPGFVFHDFTTDYPDRSLETAVFPFDALQNPSLRDNQIRWAAVVCDSNYQPFLENRFPSGRWITLGKGAENASHTRLLGMFPSSALDRKTLERWKAVHAAFKESTKRLMNRSPGDPWFKDGDPIVDAWPLAREDRFLASIASEKNMLRCLLQGDLAGAQAALKEGIRFGYPSALFWYDLGSLQLLTGDTDGGRRSLLKAVACKIDRTRAREKLDRLR
jgi:hypothetical protein